VSNLLECYEELLAVSLTDNRRIHEIVKQQKRAILAIDGMQPDVGHEVLWVIRECLSGEILLARTMLSSKGEDLEVLLKEVKTALRLLRCHPAFSSTNNTFFFQKFPHPEKNFRRPDLAI
jgi:hypothetical protein